MTREDIIEAFRQDGQLAEDVILALNIGFWDEWDCDLLSGMLHFGFGPVELQIAAKATPRTFSADDRDQARESQLIDPESYHRVWVQIKTKNAGPVKDSERSEVHSILVDSISGDLIRNLSKVPWVTEVEVK